MSDKFDEYGVDRTGNWLQMFAGPNDIDDEEEDLVGDDEEEDLEEEDLEDAGETEDEPGNEEPVTGTKSKVKFSGEQQAEVDRIVKQRLNRERAKLQQTKVQQPQSKEPEESLFDRAQVPPLASDEVNQALRLWTYLKHNQEISREVDKALQSKQGQMPAYMGPSRKAASQDSGEGDRFGLFEAKFELRSSDPVFKKYESKILAWAEREEIDIKDGKSLKLAVRAFKGAHSRLLLAQAEKRGAEQLKKDQQAASKGKGVSRKGSGKPGKVDYTKMSDADILAEEGLSLLEDD